VEPGVWTQDGGGDSQGSLVVVVGGVVLGDVSGGLDVNIYRHEPCGCWAVGPTPDTGGASSDWGRCRCSSSKKQYRKKLQAFEIHV
jgi:hypothetical protein